MGQNNNRKIYSEMDEDNNILTIWEGKSRKTDYDEELKALDHCYYIQINNGELQKISFEAVRLLGFKLIDNCIYPAEKRKRENQLKHIMELDKWM